MAHANKVRNELKAQAESLGIDPKSLTGPAHFDYMVGHSLLDKSGHELILSSILHRPIKMLFSWRPNLTVFLLARL
jgi:hypothetical protein